MNFFSLVKLAIAALWALPSALKLLYDVKAGISKIKEDAEKEKALAEFKSAIEEAKKSGDTSKLEGLYTAYVQSH